MGQSLSEAFRSLGAVIKSSYQLAPAAVGCLLIVVIPGIALVGRWSETRQATVLFLVLAVALLVYFSTKNYGEAALALAAGLFSVYSVEWSLKNFLSFVAIWIIFSVVAFLSSSVRLASRVEDIYRQAAVLSAGADEWEEREKQLQAISRFKGLGMLSPTEKADVLRLFSFRRIPVPLMKAALQATETVSIVTKVEPIRVAGLIADVTRAAEVAGDSSAQGVADSVVQTMRDAAVAPSDFFTAFEVSRNLMFREDIGVEPYFLNLRDVLEAGVRPEHSYEPLKSKLDMLDI
ncbi:MAG: hypothetical protein SX243_08175 [Acidobacteriota bacterium]|nr:hypothetical protein [Acidobacteriota bacterium]